MCLQLPIEQLINASYISVVYGTTFKSCITKWYNHSIYVLMTTFCPCSYKESITAPIHFRLHIYSCNDNWKRFCFFMNMCLRYWLNRSNTSEIFHVKIPFHSNNDSYVRLYEPEMKILTVILSICFDSEFITLYRYTAEHYYFLWINYDIINIHFSNRFDQIRISSISCEYSILWKRQFFNQKHCLIRNENREMYRTFWRKCFSE